MKTLKIMDSLSEFLIERLTNFVLNIEKRLIGIEIFIGDFRLSPSLSVFNFSLGGQIVYIV